MWHLKSNCWLRRFILILSDNNFPMLPRKCDFPVTITHHPSICFIADASWAGPPGHGPLTSLVKQRVVGHVQVFDLHLVIVDTHGGQGAGHFLLMRDRDIFVAVNLCLYRHLVAISKKWKDLRCLTFTSSHSSLSSVKTREVWRGVWGTTIDCYNIRKRTEQSKEVKDVGLQAMLTKWSLTLIHGWLTNCPMVILSLGSVFSNWTMSCLATWKNTVSVSFQFHFLWSIKNHPEVQYSQFSDIKMHLNTPTCLQASELFFRWFVFVTGFWAGGKKCFLFLNKKNPFNEKQLLGAWKKPWKRGIRLNQNSNVVGQKILSIRCSKYQTRTTEEKTTVKHIITHSERNVHLMSHGFV